MQRLEPLQNVQIGQKKLPKTYQKLIYRHNTVILCKNRSNKTPNIRKIRPF